mgnify:CR=1 FL=1
MFVVFDDRLMFIFLCEYVLQILKEYREFLRLNVPMWSSSYRCLVFKGILRDKSRPHGVRVENNEVTVGVVGCVCIQNVKLSFTYGFSNTVGLHDINS